MLALQSTFVRSGLILALLLLRSSTLRTYANVMSANVLRVPLSLTVPIPSPHTLLLSNDVVVSGSLHSLSSYVHRPFSCPTTQYNATAWNILEINLKSIVSKQ